MKPGIFTYLLISSLILSVFSEDYKSYISKLGLNLEEGTVITEDRYINTIWILTSKDPTIIMENQSFFNTVLSTVDSPF